MDGMILMNPKRVMYCIGARCRTASWMRVTISLGHRFSAKRTRKIPAKRWNITVRNTLKSFPKSWHCTKRWELLCHDIVKTRAIISVSSPFASFRCGTGNATNVGKAFERCMRRTSLKSCIAKNAIWLRYTEFLTRTFELFCDKLPSGFSFKFSQNFFRSLTVVSHQSASSTDCTRESVVVSEKWLWDTVFFVASRWHSQNTLGCGGRSRTDTDGARDRDRVITCADRHGEKSQKLLRRDRKQ